jgi:hypothetical protein
MNERPHQNLGPVTIVTFVLVMLLAGGTMAEEGGSGHYFPGSMASFMDGVSADPAFVVRLNALDYGGSFGAEREVPIGGLTALDVNVGSQAIGLTLFWRPSWGSISDKWSFAMSTTIPFVELNVSAEIDATPLGGETVRRSDSINGLGDVLLFPAMFNYKAGPNLNINARIGVYAPTGSYEVGRLANTGKNFWTVEPTVGVIYFGQKNGIEAAGFVGVDFNTENPDTDYKSGTQMHFDGTLAQHFPLWGGMAGAGASAFWYQQVTGDSGAGANLGAFKARAHGVGPAISYIRKLGQGELLVEFKWLHEFDNKNRPEGDTLFLKAMLKY